MTLSSSRFALMGIVIGAAGALTALPIGGASADGAKGGAVSAAAGAAAGLGAHVGGIAAGAGAASSTAADAASGHGAGTVDAASSNDLGVSLAGARGQGLAVGLGADTAAAIGATRGSSDDMHDGGDAATDGSAGAAVDESVSADAGANGRHHALDADIGSGTDADLLLSDANGGGAAIDAASDTEAGVHFVRATK
jgi:hypothetical protein